MGMIIGVERWVKQNLREFETDGGRQGHGGQKVNGDIKEMKECNVGEKGPGGAATACFCAPLKDHTNMKLLFLLLRRHRE